MNEPLGVIIADDHPTFRRGLRAVVEAAGFTVLAEAADGQEALSLVAGLRPDVVLLDLHMPGLNGDEVTRRLVRDVPGVRICVLTMFDDDESILACLKAGALGYLLKESGPEAIEQAIRAIAAGHAMYAPLVANRLHAYLLGAAVVPAPFPALAPREREVLELLARGLDNQSIADVLGLSAKTVRNLASKVFAKLGVARRSEAVIAARNAGMGAEPARATDPRNSNLGTDGTVK